MSQALSLTQSTITSIGTSKTNSEVIEIFNSVQKLNLKIERRVHLRQLQILYKEIPIKEFYGSIRQCLAILISNRLPSKFTHNTINFFALFCEHLQQPKKENVHPLIKKIFRFLIKNMDLETQTGNRYLCVMLFHKILKNLPRTAAYDEDLYYKIRDCMLLRLRDVSGPVRAYAANILHYFQNVENSDDCIKKAFLYHLIDPSSDVRQSVLKNLARDYKIIPNVIDRIFDVNDQVQYEAFVFLSFFGYKTFKIHHRHIILKHGLKHSSEKIKCFVENKIVSPWFESDDSIFTILSSLLLDSDEKHIQKSIYVSKLLLDVRFLSQTLDKSIEELSLDVNKIIEPSNLTYARVIYWRSLIEFINQSESECEKLAEVLPDLKLFCDFIREYIFYTSENSVDADSENLKQTILSQLFQILNYFDFTESYSKEYLKQTLIYIFTKEKISEEIADKMMDIYVKIVPKITDRITSVVAIVSNLNDPEVEIAELSHYELEWQRNKLSEIQSQKSFVLEDMESTMKFKNWNELSQLKAKLDDLIAKEKMYNKQFDPRQKFSEEEKLCQALQIIAALLHTNEIIVVNSELQTMYKHFITENIEYNSSSYKTLMALKCLIRLAIFDGNIAKAVIPMLYIQLFTSRMMENENIKLTTICLDGIVDILHIYGLQYFPESQVDTNEKPNDTNDEVDDQFEMIDKRILSNELISVILHYFKHENYKFCKTALKGLCRLLLTNRIPSISIIRDLMSFYFNSKSTIQYGKLLNIINVSFQYAAENVKGFQDLICHCCLSLLEEYEYNFAQKDTLKEIMNFVIFLTAPKQGKKGCHNKIAIMICKKIIDTCDNDLKRFYASKLSNLIIDDKNETAIKKLSALVKQINKQKKAQYVIYVQQFWDKINNTPSHASEDDELLDEIESNDSMHVIDSYGK